MQLTITPGCVATSTFRLDGNGSIGGNCNVNPASMVSPANGSTLTGSSQTFSWNAAPNAVLYQVFVGNSVGAFDIGYFPTAGTTGTSLTINGLPTDGRTLYVRLNTSIGGSWYARDYTYHAASPPPAVPASITVRPTAARSPERARPSRGMRQPAQPSTRCSSATPLARSTSAISRPRAPRARRSPSAA